MAGIGAACGAALWRPSSSSASQSHGYAAAANSTSPAASVSSVFSRRQRRLTCIERRSHFSSRVINHLFCSSLKQLQDVLGASRCSLQGFTRICTAAVAADTAGPAVAKLAGKRSVGRGSRLIGSGSAIPSVVVSNEALSALVETNDEWISTRTGIRNRRILSGEESLTGLAVEACQKALEMGKVDAENVDLVILCTSTPEDIFGGACMIQAALGCKRAVAFDLTAACSGFVMGLVTATRFIRGGGFENVLVIGADALSRYVDWTDRGTCILFGDGCGAVLVRAAADDEEDGLLGFDMRSDGQGNRHLHATVNATSNGAVAGNGAAALQLPGKANANYIQMNGKEVFKFAVRAVPQVVDTAMEEAGLTPADLDWLLLHQANQRILDAVSEKMSIPSERVISNLQNYGNTSAASIPLALDEAIRAGKVQPGHVVATAGFGAGLTWASAIFRWG